jgi:hypothetical protein
MVKIGILGFAHGHINAIATQWQEHPEMGVQVVAGWDHDAARCAQHCEKFGLKQCGTVQELLDSGIDAVAITSETSFHAELAEQAAAAKKNIIMYPVPIGASTMERISTISVMGSTEERDSFILAFIFRFMQDIPPLS